MKKTFVLFALLSSTFSPLSAMEAEQADDRVEDSSNNNNNRAQQADSFLEEDREDDISASYILLSTSEQLNFKEDAQKGRLIANNLVLKKGEKDGVAQSLHSQSELLVEEIVALEDEKHQWERDLEEKRKLLESQKAQIQSTKDAEIAQARTTEAEGTAKLIATLENKIQERTAHIAQKKAAKDAIGKHFLQAVETRERAVGQLVRVGDQNPDLLAGPVREELSALQRERQQREQLRQQQERERQLAEQAAAKSWWQCIIA